jgi:hypothetical protein
VAIKGVSEIRRFPRAGKIHLGDKAISEKTGKEYPKALDYFKWPEEYEETLTSLFGEKCREFPIMFLVEDQEMVAPQYYKRYGSGSGLICRGDGETAVMRNDEGELVEIDCPGQDCPWYEKKHCRHVMNLQFVIPQLVSEGIFQIDTSSYHSIVNFNSSWHFVKALTGGRIAMVPLVLRIIPKEVNPDGKKKVVYVLELKLAQRMGLNDLQAIVEGQAPRAELPAADETSEKDYFYPKEVRDRPPAPESQAEIIVSEDLQGDLEVAEAEDVPDELDNQIEDLCASLGLTQGQRELRWRKVEGDKQAMVDLLNQEYEEKGEKKSPRRGRGQQNKDAASAGESGQAEKPRAASDDNGPATPAASNKMTPSAKSFF